MPLPTESSCSPQFIFFSLTVTCPISIYKLLMCTLPIVVAQYFNYCIEHSLFFTTQGVSLLSLFMLLTVSSINFIGMYLCLLIYFIGMYLLPLECSPFSLSSYCSLCLPIYHKIHWDLSVVSVLPSLKGL